MYSCDEDDSSEQKEDKVIRWEIFFVFFFSGSKLTESTPVYMRKKFDMVMLIARRYDDDKMRRN